MVNNNTIDQAINQSDERYKSLFDGNYSVMLLINPVTGEIKDANMAASHYYGWSNKELCSMHISEINTLSQDEVEAEMQKAIKENRNQFLFRHRLANGEIRDVEVYSGPIRFHDATLLYSIVHDITERKRTEEALRKSEENYRFMFANNPQPMWIIDLETLEFIEVNNAAIMHYGYSQDEFRSMTLKDIRPDKDVQALLEDMEQYKSADKSLNWIGEWLHKKKNGELINVEITSLALDFNGRYAAHALINDITAQRKSEQLLKQTQLNYEGFFNTIDEFVFVLDQRGCILHANETVYNRLGFTPEEVIGMPVTDVHPADQRAEAARIVGEMLMGVTDSCPIPILTKSGVQIPVETRVKEGLWDGKPVIFGFTKDITKIRLSQEKFSKVFHLNPSPAILVDFDDYQNCEFNEAFFRVYGFERKDVIGKTPFRLGILSPKTIELVNKLTNENGLLNNVEIEVIAKNGDVKVALLSSDIIYVQGRKFRYDVLHDITDLKQAESEIVGKVSLLTNLIINLGEGILLENSTREIVLTNQLFCDMFGIPAPPDAMIGADCSGSAEQSKVLFKDPDQFVSDIKSILSNRKVRLNDELELVDGRYFERDYIPTYLNNEYSGHLWKYRDVTERKTAEMALKDSQALYQSFVDQMPAGVIRLDADGCVIFANSLFCEIENLNINEISGKKIEDICQAKFSTDIDISEFTHKPGTFSSLDRIHHDLIMLNEESIQFEEKHLREDGSIQFLQVVKYPVFSSLGKVVGSQEIQFDISERKRAEEALHLQSNLQKLLMVMSSTYISLPVDAINTSLYNSLENIAKFVFADRAYIFDYDFEKKICNNTHEWCEDGITPQINELQSIPTDALPDWVETHSSGRPLYVPDVFALPHSDLRAILEPQEIKSLITVPLMNNDTCLGFVGFDWVKYHHVSTDFEIRLLKGFAQMLVNLWQRKWSEEALVESQKQLKDFASHLQNIREEERVVLAREIHDDLGQKVVALKIDVGLLKQKLIREDNDSRTEKLVLQLNGILELIENTIITTRRILSGLRPEMLEMMGFVYSVNKYLEEFQVRYHVECNFDCKLPTFEVNPQKSLALYRIVQEALNNVAKHAKATKVEVQLVVENDKLILIIADNGKGFSMDKKGRNDSYGLIGMRERTFLLDGELLINSEIGVGTQLIVKMPYLNKPVAEIK